MASIPSKYKEHLFRQMVVYYLEALAAEPNCIEVDPSPIAQDTFTRRFRESREAKNLFGWKWPGLDDFNWSKVQDFRTHMTPHGTVMIGTLESLKKPARKIGQVKDQTLTGVVECRPELLVYLAQAWSGLTPRPTNFIVRNLLPDTVHEIESRYDMGLMQDEVDNALWRIV